MAISFDCTDDERCETCRFFRPETLEHKYMGYGYGDPIDAYKLVRTTLMDVQRGKFAKGEG
jgi:hypothetical protein